MRNKSSKGFTLIELLVVVAIIGILAAVGVVAYNGYTKSAKKSASASNHASVVKYVAAELAKCGIESTAFDGWDCSNKSKTVITGDDSGPSGAAVAALSDFKNAYTPTTNAVTHDSDPGKASVTKGNTVVSNDASTVTISTCTDEACAEVKTNTVAID